jgi:HlyD family secretion protein
MKRNEEIELHSEEVNDILSRPPKWIISWGVTLIFIIILVLISGSVFFRYPEIITATVTVSSRNLPVHLRARTSGKIISFFVDDSSVVVPGTHLVLLESTTNYNDYLTLERFCNEFRNAFQNDIYAPQSVAFHNISNLQLGSLQSFFSEFIKSLEDYNRFVTAGYHSKKISLLEKQLSEQKYILDLGEDQLTGVREQYSLAKKSFARDSLLFSNGVLSQADFEQSSIKWFASHQTMENMKTTNANIRLGILQTEQLIFELRNEFEEQFQRNKRILKGNFDHLISQMADWLQNYVLESPIYGSVSYSRFWQENQNVIAGDVVLTIIPQDKEGVAGKLYLSIVGTGKVKNGQRVNIKLDNYPYMEYGMLEGRVRNISNVPVEVDGTNLIVVDVELKNGLLSNYGIMLSSGEIMKGTADIVTEEMSMFKRLIIPLRHLINTRVK